MRNRTSPDQGSQDLAAIPTAQGGLSRLVIERLKSAGVAVGPLLRRAKLTPAQIAEPDARISVRSQITLLDEAGIALKDDRIGFTLARDFDLRKIGLVYYVMASSPTLGEALKRIARYSKIANEALAFGYREGNRGIVSLSYSGVSRHSDRHQIEFCMFAVLRICRALTGQHLTPLHFLLRHLRSEATAEMAQFIGTQVEFGAESDEFSLNADALRLPLVHADPYLNDLLLKYCEAVLADRRADLSSLRTKVENVISSLLPHGRVSAGDVARNLGISERTLARRLSDEGFAFSEVLQELKRDLAVRYLDDRNLHISKIAWLLGYQEVSAFTHAFKRWTGKTPSELRRASA